MFKIVTTEHYKDLKNEVESWKDLFYQRDKISDDYRDKYYSLVREKEKDRKDMANGVEFTSFSLSKNGNVYEVVRKSDGKFVASQGFNTVEDATNMAHHVAKLFPTEVFFVYAPVKIVRAEIPVVEEEFTVDTAADIS